MSTKLPPELENHPLFREGSSFGIISGEAPRYQGELNSTGHEGLKAQLKLMGLPHEETHGYYDGPEKSVLVYGPSREQMFKLGKSFGQESVIWGHNHRNQPGGMHAELLYSNGPHVGHAHLPHDTHPLVEHFHTPPENNYTHIPGGKGYFRFNLDFNKLHPVPLSVGTQHPQALAPAQTPRPDLKKNLRDAAARRPVSAHPHAYPWHDGHTSHNVLHVAPGAVLIKNDGGRTDQSLMDNHFHLGGSFTKGDNIGGPNSAGDMSVPPPRGSFSHMADVLGQHNDGQLGKGAITDPSMGLQPLKGSFAKEEPGEAKHQPGDERRALRGSAAYQAAAHPYGTLAPDDPQGLRHYRLEGRRAEVERQVKDHGFTVHMHGGRRGHPDFTSKNYDTRHLAIPDAEDEGHQDAHTTNAWRQQHELAHALTLPEVNKLYGEAKRTGKMGAHRNLNEARRAVHWEWLAVQRQRQLAAQLGIHLSEQDFAREANTIMHDAVHRVTTGTYTDPSAEGFRPHTHLVPLTTAMDLVNEHGRKLGLQDPHSLGKSELHKAAMGTPPPVKPPAIVRPAEDVQGRAGDAFSELDATAAANPQQRQHQAVPQHVPPHFIPPHKHSLPAPKPQVQAQAQAQPHTVRLQSQNPVEREAARQQLIFSIKAALDPKTGTQNPGMRGAMSQELELLQNNGSTPNLKSERQSTTLATEHRSMADDSKNAEPRFFTPQQARMLLAKALGERIEAYAETLQELQKREAGETVNAQNSPEDKKWRADTAAATAAGKKGVPAKPGDGVAKTGLEKVAPPGREEQVRALKPEHGTASAFKIAWASYNHGREAKKNMTGGSENVSSGTPGLMMNEGGMPTGHDAMPNPPSSMNLAEADGGHKPDGALLRQKQAVPVKTDDPRSNNFVTAGNNQTNKAEPKDAQGKTDGRHEPRIHVGHRQQGVLAGDAQPQHRSHGTASGNIHPSALPPGGNSPSNKVPDKAITKADTVPTAKPPTGNPAVGAVPQSKPAAKPVIKGNLQASVIGGALGGFKGAFAAARGPKAPHQALQQHELGKADLSTPQGGAAQASFQAAKPAATAAPAPKMPTQAEHAQRAQGFAEHTPPGKFGPAAGAPAAVAKPAAPAPAAKPAAPAAAPTATLKPPPTPGAVTPGSSPQLVGSSSAFGAAPKPLGGALGALPKLTAVLNRPKPPKGGAPGLRQSEKK